jgi:hypothetical protein
MRVNLLTPFAEKDAAKALGARWDSKQKVWYVQDATDLSPFMRWIPDLAAATVGVPAAAPRPAAAPGAALPGRTITTPSVQVPGCGCAVLPWEDCIHSLASAQGRQAPAGR